MSEEELLLQRAKESLAAAKLIWIGDYGIEDSVSTSDAMQTVEWAEEFIQAAEHYIG